MDSARNVERTIEAAKALLSEEKMLAGEERAEKSLSESEWLTRTSKDLTSSEQGFMPKTADTLKNKGTLRRSKAPYYFFSAAFCIWVVLLLVVYIPISGLTTPIFPFIIDNNMMMCFLASAGLASLISLFIGINMLRGKGL